MLGRTSDTDALAIVAPSRQKSKRHAD